MKKNKSKKDRQLIIPTGFSVQELTVTNMPVDELTSNIVEPVQRLKEKSLTNLAACIIVTKFIAPIVIVKSALRSIILDGHRRLAAAKMIGLKEIPCIIMPLTDSRMMAAVVRFIQLNSVSAEFRGGQYLSVWKTAPDKKVALAAIRPTTRERIEKLIKFAGSEQALMDIVDNIASPNLADQVEATGRLFKMFGFKFDQRKVLRWLALNPGMSYLVRHTLREHREGKLQRIHAEKLAAAAAAGVPCDFSKPLRRKTA